MTTSCGASAASLHRASSTGKEPDQGRLLVANRGHLMETVSIFVFANKYKLLAFKICTLENAQRHSNASNQ